MMLGGLSLLTVLRVNLSRFISRDFNGFKGDNLLISNLFSIFSIFIILSLSLVLKPSRGLMSYCFWTA